MAASNTPEAVILPLAGVANPGCRGHNFAELHFYKLRRQLSKCLGLPVAKPIVPVALGCFKPMEQIYDEAEADSDRLLAKYPESKVLLVGHSLGGLLCREMIARNQDNEQYVGAIALGAPLGPIEPWHWGVAAPIVRGINRFSAQCSSLPQNNTPLKLIGAQKDLIVPARAALKPSGDAARYLLGSAGLAGRLGAEAVPHRGFVDHNQLLLNQAAVDLTVKLSGHLLERAGINLHQEELSITFSPEVA